jgi:hypothetical protein
MDESLSERPNIRAYSAHDLLSDGGRYVPHFVITAQVSQRGQFGPNGFTLAAQIPFDELA